MASYGVEELNLEQDEEDGLLVSCGGPVGPGSEIEPGVKGKMGMLHEKEHFIPPTEQFTQMGRVSSHCEWLVSGSLEAAPQGLWTTSLYVPPFAISTPISRLVVCSACHFAPGCR